METNTNQNEKIEIIIKKGNDKNLVRQHPINGPKLFL